MENLSEDQVFCELFKLNREESVNIKVSFDQPLLRAISCFTKILQNKNACNLFLRLAQEFKPEIELCEVKTIFDEVYQRGCDVYIGHLLDAIMQCAPFPNAKCPELKRPQLFFDVLHGFVECSNRAEEDAKEYAHIVKMLHEFCHFLVPYLLQATGVDIKSIIQQAEQAIAEDNEEAVDKLMTMLSTPPKLGTVVKEKRNRSESWFSGDCGSEWEELQVDGRVVPANNLDPSKRLCSSPFSGGLLLLRRKDRNEPPKWNNVELLKISEDYIHGFLQSLHSLELAEPLPDFKIPQCYLKEVDETRKTAPKRQKTRHALSSGGVIPNSASTGPTEDSADSDSDDLSDSDVPTSLRGAAYGMCFTKDQVDAIRSRGARF